MKPWFVLLLLVYCMVVGCETGIEHKETTAPQPALETKPSLDQFADTLSSLDIQTNGVLTTAVTLYAQLAPHDSTGADSAAAALMQFVDRVVKKENDSLYNSREDFSPLLHPENTILSNRQKAVETSLHANRLKLVSDGEGGVLVTPNYATILPTIKERTSLPVDNFLDLVAKDDTTPVFRDAGLAVDVTELVDRLVLSEQLLSQSLPQRFAREAERLNNFYTHALVHGADNSPSISTTTHALNENFREGYNYLLAKYPSTKAAATINVWLAVVASGDQKKIEAFRQTMQ